MGKVGAGFHDCVDLGDGGACRMFCSIAFDVLAQIGVDHRFSIAGLNHHHIAIESCDVKECSINGVAHHSGRT